MDPVSPLNIEPRLKASISTMLRGRQCRLFSSAPPVARAQLRMPPRAVPEAGRGSEEPARPAARSLLNPLTVAFTSGCAALVAAGAIPVHDLVFSIVWPTYLLGMDKLRFKENAEGRSRGPLVPEDWVRKYAAGAAVLAIFLPGLLCLLNRGNAAVLAAAGPHLYLTTAQVLCEYLLGSRTALLPRMLVPLGFNTYRMWTLWVWCSTAVAAGFGPWHVGLAVANLVFWAYNLFIFLLTNMLPRYLVS